MLGKSDKHIIFLKGTVTKLRQNTQGTSLILVPLCQQAFCQLGTQSDTVSGKLVSEREEEHGLNPTDVFLYFYLSLKSLLLLPIPICLVNVKSHFIPVLKHTAPYLSVCEPQFHQHLPAWLSPSPDLKMWCSNKGSYLMWQCETISGAQLVWELMDLMMNGNETHSGVKVPNK